ncbi:hypothetical protein [Methylomicrobium sp. Wu6]|uniref:hypothetical protein n=1 Tax=Methylomicrobium sp. Wu6 TaxID=3107928 RepID=UPI002DD6334F|nr:hypothetical protein [Methylomicrobium sp. Wu6]MEC4749868.1 hypothetical protein [Methylomicrobium sp. Wu6]
MMTLDRKKNDAIDALAKLAGGMDGKSDTAKIREVIDSVELALSSGVHREKVFDTLRESLGIKMNFRTFETTLHRIRNKRKNESLEVDTNQKQNQLETMKNDFEEPNRFITPKERRSFGINALKEIDEENHIED